MCPSQSANRKLRCTRPGVAMSKRQPSSPLAIASARENVPGQQAESVRGKPGPSEIGFVGLGHMGTAMAANLAANGRRVIAYVRRPDQIGRLEALGLIPTTDIGNLLDCK